MQGRRLTNLIFLLIFVLVFSFLTPSTGAAGVWDIEPDIPDYDPLWKEVDKLWNHSERDVDDINEIIIVINKLRKKYPDKKEVVLWTAWAYNQKALRGSSSERPGNLKIGVAYAQQAYNMTKDPRAFKILVSSVGAFKDIDDLKKKHGKWIKAATPLATGRALPEMSGFPEWKEAIKSWDCRLDIKRAHYAVDLLQKIADREKSNETAQTWACRGMYYLGQYYEFEGERDKSVSYYEKGADYGRKALKLNSKNVPANYWYFLTLGKSIEFKSLYVKIFNSKDMMDNILIFMYENPLYYYCSPMMVVADAIAQEAFIMSNIMDLIGFDIGQIITGLEMAEICYPDYFRITFCKARLMYNLDKEKEAKKILDDLLKRDPRVSKSHAAENHFTLKEVKAFLKEAD